MDDDSRGSWRRSAPGYAALAVLIVIGVGAGGLSLADGDQDTTNLAEDPTTSASPATPGSGIACPRGVAPQQSVFDHSGYGSFTELLRTEAGFRGSYVVDRAKERFLYLRDDGSVHTEVVWMGEPRDGGGNRSDWFPSSESACSDEESWTGVPLDLVESAQPLTLDVGHCWIEPVSFDGRMWDVVEEEQFGWGGQQPTDFRGTGEAWRAGDIVTYVDASGHWLTLVPAGDPWALDRGFCD
ncbi:MAG: hypothetical protein M3237_09195 [Actinomycetota bacterium]|nr:hypothetical protein [Actinomycetota bacterium]